MTVLTEGIDPELREVLNDVSYPTDKWQIVGCAEIHGFEVSVRRRLYRLPVRRYTSAADVTSALGPQETERTR